MLSWLIDAEAELILARPRQHLRDYFCKDTTQRMKSVAHSSIYNLQYRLAVSLLAHHASNHDHRREYRCGTLLQILSGKQYYIKVNETLKIKTHNIFIYSI